MTKPYAFLTAPSPSTRTRNAPSSSMLPPLSHRSWAWHHDDHHDDDDDDDKDDDFHSEPNIMMHPQQEHDAQFQLSNNNNFPIQQSSRSTTRRSFLSLVAFVTTAASTSTSTLTTTTTTSPSSITTTSIASFLTRNSIANAAETIGKDANCNDSTCLGIWDGLFADCPHDDKNKLLFSGGGAGAGAGCVSSQDDTPGVFAEPWDYSDLVPLSPSSSSSNTNHAAAAADNDDDSESNNDKFYQRQMDLLILAIQTSASGNNGGGGGDTVQIVFQQGRYLRVLFTDGSSGEQSIGEFYFTPNDTTVQFRVGAIPSLSSSSSSSSKKIIPRGRSLSNMERTERLRKSLRYLKVPVLRNRKRSFFFVESDEFDGFGPGSNALGPPEEMSPGDLGVVDGIVVGGGGGGGGGRTRRGSDEVDPRLRIDWVEEFPLKKKNQQLQQGGF